VLHITIWGIEAFTGGLSGDRTELWAPCDSVPPQLGGMECGLYGSVDNLLKLEHYAGLKN